MIRTACLAILMLTFSVAAGAAEPLQSRPEPQQSVDPSRTPKDIESCFGASNEKDEDLKTGNEEVVEQLLKQMLNPGS